jgi:hypothetical protein
VEKIEFDTGDRQQDFYIDPVAEKKLVQKLDWKLIPWLCLLYLISFLDRTNIGNAAILGLSPILPFDLLYLTVFRAWQGFGYKGKSV